MAKHYEIQHLWHAPLISIFWLHYFFKNALAFCIFILIATN